ncbi:hypothetical protein BJX66DRAFT_345950 [Aspergillus keveii]|uniref:Uncharacterized protein n=1 Tax=Aspergillus keveii TaxID=714993 RepID=A0ABR4FGH1_9EURO
MNALAPSQVLSALPQLRMAVAEEVVGLIAEAVEAEEAGEVEEEVAVAAYLGQEHADDIFSSPRVEAQQASHKTQKKGTKPGEANGAGKGAWDVRLTTSRVIRAA